MRLTDKSLLFYPSSFAFSAPDKTDNPHSHTDRSYDKQGDRQRQCLDYSFHVIILVALLSSSALY
jgi:hypothetical protein